jgi:hypothetical protein
MCSRNTSSKLRNGYFTYYLIQALKRDAGLEPIDKVYTYVRDNVSEQVSAEVHTHQTPIVSRSESGVEIVIGVAHQRDHIFRVFECSRIIMKCS